MSIDKNVPPFVAHFDGNQVPSIIGVEGTLGTTDSGGTARPMPIGVNPTTGAMYVQDLSGVAGTQNVQIVGGTFNAGTVTTALNSGTITTIAAGTQNTLGTVGTILGIGGTVAVSGASAGTNVNIVTGSSVGTILGGTLQNLVSGTVNLGTVVGANAVAGTSTTNPIQIGGTSSTGTVYTMLVDTAGNPQVDVVTVPQVSVGTVPQVSIGTLPTLNLTTGTITTGSLTNLAGLHTGTITTGSITDVAKLYNGSVNILTGTIQSSGTTTGVGVVSSVSELVKGTVTNLVSGTINALASGTITGGTLGNLNYGTVAIDAKPAGSNILTTHTLGTGGGTFFGTMVAPVGAGTYIYLTGVSIVGRSGGSIDVGIANNVEGTTGAGVIARGFFPTAGGGIRQEFNPALRLGTNGTLAYFLITAGTADFTAQYWVGP